MASALSSAEYKIFPGGHTELIGSAHNGIKSYRVDDSLSHEEKEVVKQIFYRAAANIGNLPGLSADADKNLFYSLSNQSSLAVLVTRLFIALEKREDETICSLKELADRLLGLNQNDIFIELGHEVEAHYFKWIEGQGDEADKSGDTKKKTRFVSVKKLALGQVKLLTAVRVRQSNRINIGNFTECMFAPEWFQQIVRDQFPRAGGK